MMVFGLFPLLGFLFFLLFFRGVSGLFSRINGEKGRFRVPAVSSCGGEANYPTESIEKTEGQREAKIFRLADANGGVLTLSDVVVGLGYTIKAGEKRMNALVDGLRVRMEVGDDGGIRYEFPEIMHRRPAATRRLTDVEEDEK
jgi:hypothetical protein